MPFADYPARSAEAECISALACGRYPSIGECEASVTVGLPPQTAADVASGKVHYDGKAAAACFTGHQNDCMYSVSKLDSPCSHILVGTIPQGGACSAWGQCKDSVCITAMLCDPGVCCPGTCMPSTATGRPVGAACQSSENCVLSAAACVQGTCQPRVALGAACDWINDNCPVFTFCIDGVCRQPAPRGGNCGVCDDVGHDFCDPDTGKCLPRPGVGSPCGSGGVCGLDATCFEASHTCIALGGVGRPCDAAENCLSGLACTNGVCSKVVPPPQPPVCP